jgi:hypothetical protein
VSLVTLRTFRYPIEADLAKAKLEGAGIPAVLVDDNLASVYSGAVPGIRLQVAESDLASAREALREDHSADLADMPEGESPLLDGETPAETLEAELRVFEPRMYLRSILAVVAGLALLYYVWHQIHSSG